MDRLAKGTRVSCGIVLLCNIAVFFLPLTLIRQPNYEDVKYSQFDYMKGIFQGLSLPGGENSLAAIQTTAILALMLLPVLLSLAAGIYGVVGSPRQIFTSIAAFFICALYIGLLLFMSAMWPPAKPEQVYEKGLAVWIDLGVSAAASILGIVALITTPRIRKAESSSIPQIMEIREEQIQAKYNIIAETESGPAGAGQQASQGGAPGQPAGGQAPAGGAPGQSPGGMPGQVAGGQTSPGGMPGQMSGGQTSPGGMPGQSPGGQALPGGGTMPPYDPTNPRGVMVGYTGMYAGAEIPFRDKETIQLGRLPDNDLVFEGQSHISRKHCAITWDAERKKFQIMDYSSSGSYINGSDECLPQNMKMWLEPGTVIEFGNEENKFRLE